MQYIFSSANYVALQPTRLYSLYPVFIMHDSKWCETNEVSTEKGQVKFHSETKGHII